MDASNLLTQFKILNDEIISEIDKNSKIHYNIRKQMDLLAEFLAQNPSEESISLIVEIINDSQKF